MKIKRKKENKIYFKIRKLKLPNRVFRLSSVGKLQVFGLFIGMSSPAQEQERSSWRKFKSSAKWDQMSISSVRTKQSGIHGVNKFCSRPFKIHNIDLTKYFDARSLGFAYDSIIATLEFSVSRRNIARYCKVQSDLTHFSVCFGFRIVLWTTA